MKKILLSTLLFLMLVFITGCGNETNDDVENIIDNIEDKSTETSNTTEDDKIDLYSDDTKMVFKNGTGSLVYYYSGDKITGYHAYLDYGDAATAKYALTIMDKDLENIKNAYTKGRYLVIEYNESEYEDMTASEVKALYSYLEEVQKSN